MSKSNTLTSTWGYIALLGAAVLDVTTPFSEIATAIYFLSLLYLGSSISSQRVFLAIGSSCSLFILLSGFIVSYTRKTVVDGTDTVFDSSTDILFVYGEPVIIAVLVLMFTFAVKSLKESSKQQINDTKISYKTLPMSSETVDSDKEIAPVNIEGTDRIRFERFANSLPIFTATFTPSGEIDFLSHNYQTFFGQDLDVIKEDWQSLIHDDDAPSVFEK